MTRSSNSKKTQKLLENAEQNDLVSSFMTPDNPAVTEFMERPRSENGLFTDMEECNFQFDASSTKVHHLTNPLINLALEKKVIVQPTNKCYYTDPQVTDVECFLSPNAYEHVQAMGKNLSDGRKVCQALARLGNAKKNRDFYPGVENLLFKMVSIFAKSSGCKLKSTKANQKGNDDLDPLLPPGEEALTDSNDPPPPAKAPLSVFDSPKQQTVSM